MESEKNIKITLAISIRRPIMQEPSEIAARIAAISVGSFGRLDKGQTGGAGGPISEYADAVECFRRSTASAFFLESEYEND